MKIKNEIKKIIKYIIQVNKEQKQVPYPVQINTSKLLIGKVALITGGSSGIGLAIAKSFIKNGAKVIIAATNEEKLKKSIDLIECEKGYINYIILDVTKIDTFEKKIYEALTKFNEKKIDILVNSAGLVCHSDFLSVNEKEYDDIMNINLKGTFFLSQSVVKYMIENNIKGHILNISSSSALRPGWTPYQISKWGIKGFTLGLADICQKHNIIVNAIAPGPVATPMLNKYDTENIDNIGVRLGRFEMPDEIANLATILVSDMGNVVVGDTLYATGGSGNLDYHK